MPVLIFGSFARGLFLWLCPGIVTRCPLELKMKRNKQGQEWHGKISYQGKEEEMNDPAEVEKKIREGTAMLRRVTAIGWMWFYLLYLWIKPRVLCSSGPNGRGWVRNQRWPHQPGDCLVRCARPDAHWPARHHQGGCKGTAREHRRASMMAQQSLINTSLKSLHNSWTDNQPLKVFN